MDPCGALRQRVAQLERELAEFDRYAANVMDARDAMMQVAHLIASRPEPGTDDEGYDTDPGSARTRLDRERAGRVRSLDEARGELARCTGERFVAAPVDYRAPDEETVEAAADQAIPATAPAALSRWPMVAIGGTIAVGLAIGVVARAGGPETPGPTSAVTASPAPAALAASAAVAPASGAGASGSPSLRQWDFSRGGDSEGVVGRDFELTVGVTEPARSVSFVFESASGQAAVAGDMTPRTDPNARPGQDWHFKGPLAADTYVPKVTVTLPDGRTKDHTFSSFVVKKPG